MTLNDPEKNFVFLCDFVPFDRHPRAAEALAEAQGLPKAMPGAFVASCLTLRALLLQYLLKPFTPSPFLAIFIA